MNIFSSLNDLPERFRHGAIAIGNFDGVHQGHARIVQRLVESARSLGGPAVVFTFDPHPGAVLRPEAAPPPLTHTRRKAALLAECGVDALVAYPTNREFLQIGPFEFFDEIVCRRLDARAMVEGVDFFFGRNRAGNIDTLRQFCHGAGIALEIVSPVEVDGQVVSSSRVRRAVSEGRIDDVGRMLTQPYQLSGLVVHGAGRGRRLGFPTANLAEIGTLVPREGIYAGRVSVEGQVWPAAISLGPNPTFGEGAIKVEVHLIGYQGWLYDRPLEVDFLARLRDVERFTSVEELLVQMDRDIAAARQIAAQRAA